MSVERGEEEKKRKRKKKNPLGDIFDITAISIGNISRLVTSLLVGFLNLRGFGLTMELSSASTWKLVRSEKQTVLYLAIALATVI